MAYKNVKELLVDATKFPAAIEAKLPAGAPTISATLIDVAGKIPVVPDFPMEIPALPAPPELPAMPEFPGGDLGRRRYVSGVEVTPIPTPAPSPQIHERAARPVTAEIVS
ncbi:unnamed protein product [marine sediment metagenome]|uniref:Uncharacterized protein n=1 Tax=marine sediment metagenome TaxID=412755 RepID=X1UF09_9ZZZZ